MIRKGKQRVLISPDGSKVVYTAFEDGKTQLYEAAVSGGSPRRLCDNCDAVPLGWSPNGFEIVYWYGQPIRFGLLNVASGERQPILQHPEYHLHRAQISPDERWIAFYVPTNRIEYSLHHSGVGQHLGKVNGSRSPMVRTVTLSGRRMAACCILYPKETASAASGLNVWIQQRSTHSDHPSTCITSTTHAARCPTQPKGDGECRSRGTSWSLAWPRSPATSGWQSRVDRI